MVRRLLIANRGEIAVRVVRACRELGIGAVVVCAPDDADALAATLADAVAPVPSYLDAGAIVEAGIAADVDAVHPGYGFLSEDPGFAEAVVEAGLTWVGPPPAAMRALGDKVEARAIAARAGVPTVEGASGDDAAIVAAARELGPPLLVKAAAGGGGRGMRAVDDVETIGGALEAARAEAAAAFGDDRVFVERRLIGARHVEVQILADTRGAGAHLGERDCSLQRRHQKVVEEAPSPAVDQTLRAQLGGAAIAVALEAGYVGAGTAEFLLLPDGGFRFLEMNARLQVEHPVTEAVTGVDLVHTQIAIARGEPLDAQLGDIEPRGHAIEARVYAEDPANGFLPTGGRVERLALPRWPGIRIDTALRQGEVVGTSYDPLLAKVIAHAPDRSRALAKLRVVLAEVEIVGVVTNLGFLIDALGHDDVVAARADTDWVEAVWRADPPALPEGVAAAVVDPRDPWHAFGDGPGPRPEDRGDGSAVGATSRVAVAGGWAQFRGWAYRLSDDELDPVALAPPGGSLTAPMPASVQRVAVADGDHVEAGDVLLVLEAMKMQIQIRTPTDGTVVAIHVRDGDTVAAGQILVEVQEP